MFRPIRLILPCLAVLFLGVQQAAAWTPRVHEEIALQSARLMPRALESVLANHTTRLKAGARAPLALAGHESLYLHAGGSYGKLDQAIFAQCQRILDLLSSRASMDTVAYEFGVLSHYVALAENPLNVAADDPREAEWAGSFRRLTERRMPRFKVVFTGYLSEPLQRDDIRGFVRSTCDRSRNHYKLLAQSYKREDGGITSNSAISDRHPVFGMASIGFSRSITDTAKLWLYLWIKAGGDTRHLPFPGGLKTSNAILSGVGQ